MADAEKAINCAWQELVETPDVTSPEDYPDHALITRDQLADFMSRATPPAVVVEAMERALRPFAFFNEDNANEDIQTAWETRYRDRFRDWIDFGDIEAVRAALADLEAWRAGK